MAGAERAYHCDSEPSRKRRKMSTMADYTEEDIAIVGVGCRFPGADNVDEFWRVLVNGENHVREIPSDRWNNDAFYAENKDTQGKFYVRHAGLLNNHDAWDNHFFGVSDAEAARVDPQQRYVLECTHMAMEDAGITKSQINGTKTGVYVGAMNDDYKSLFNSDPDAEMTSYSSTGMSTTLISNRVSYIYNLHGPSMTLDTACSSSLVAIHLGSQAILSGDCDRAICGGVSSIINPGPNKALCKARMMSNVGQCQSFCNTADGYVRAEGCGIVILQKLSDAKASNCKIWGVLKTGFNQDGRTVEPITAPSVERQTALLENVYTKYGIKAADVHYAEAHGTGTPIGDPIEVNTLGEFFSKHRHVNDGKLLIGSVKTNIGHTESAAGIAGLIKVLLMMQKGKLVPSLHVKKDKTNVNRNIKLQQYNIDIVTDVQDWKVDSNGLRLACVNSFGFGGSNAHAVVIQCPAENLKIPKYFTTGAIHPVAISAPDKLTLEKNMAALQNDLESSDLAVEELSYTSLHHREQMQFRTLVFGKDNFELQEQLRLRQKTIDSVNREQKVNVIFVYSGMGTAWTGMCREMMNVSSFRQKIEDIDVHLKPLAGWSIGEKFLSETTRYGDPFLGQIAIFSVQVALSAVWLDWNIRPDFIVGQSVGEVAAAHISGKVSLDEAVRVIYVRSQILATQTGGGMMVVSNMNVADIEALCARHGNVCIAVYNSPVSCTLSGDPTKLRQIRDDLKGQQTNGRQKVFVSELNVQCAYHSPYVERCAQTIESEIGQLQDPGQTQYQIISTVTGRKASSTDFVSGKYWADNVRKQVLFYQALRLTMVEDARNVFLEIGPKQVMRVHLDRIIQGQRGVCLASMNENSELSCCMASLTEMFQMGVDIQEHSIDLIKRQPVPLPRYAFSKTKHLYMSEKMKQDLAGVTETKFQSHMFIAQLPSSDEPTFRIDINKTSTPFVYDHFFSGEVLVPGAVYVEAGMQVGTVHFNKQINAISVSLEFHSPVMPRKDKNVVIDVHSHVTNDGDVTMKFRGNGTICATGRICLRATPQFKQLKIEDILRRCPTVRNKKASYTCLKKLQLVYGPSLSLIEKSWSGKDECLVKFKVPTVISDDFTKTKFHPAVIDAVFQTFGILLDNKLMDTKAQILPVKVDNVVINGPLLDNMYAYARLKNDSSEGNHVNAVLLSEDGAVIAELGDFVTKSLSPHHSRSNDGSVDKYKIAYVRHETSINDRLIQGSVLVCGPTQMSNWFSEFTERQKIFVKVSSAYTFEQPNISAVVYYTSSQLLETQILEGALQRFKQLKDLLMKMSSMKVLVPLFVVTENTQERPKRKGKQINLCGSEYWGMVRAFRHEDLHRDIRLVDIDPEEFDESLFMATLSYAGDVNAELILSCTDAYHVQFSPRLGKVKHLRNIVMDSQQEATLYSTDCTDIVFPYFKGTDTACTKLHKEKSNMYHVQLSSIVVHEKSLFLQSDTLDSFLGDFEKNEPDESFKRIAVEGKGTRISSGKLEDIIFCCPIHVSTPHVSVPKECVLSAASYPNYQNGMLVMYTLLYRLVKTIPNKSEVLVIGNGHEHNDTVAVLALLLEQRRCNVRGILLGDLEVDGGQVIHKNETVLLAATNVDDNVLGNLMNKVTHGNRIVTLSTVISNTTCSLIRFKYPDVDIDVIDTMDIFQPKSLKKMFPEVKTLLRQIDYNDRRTRPRNILFWEYPVRSFVLDSNCIKDIPLQVDQAGLFRRHGCYIVIGGLTGLGWILVQHMASLGAGNIAIFSRTTPPSKRKSDIQTLQQNFKCKIRHYEVDICDFQSLKATIQRVECDLGQEPIRGIFNGAATLNDKLLINQTDVTIQKVMSPKMQGSWNLHMCSKDMSLDFFVMQSSIVSLTGNAGQTNYAAGNSFIDALALHRRGLGLPGQSINWGALGVGMATDPSVRDNLLRQGMGVLSEMDIKECFIQALLEDDSGICFARMDWDKLSQKEAYFKQSNKFSHLIRRTPVQRRTEHISRHLEQIPRNTERIRETVWQLAVHEFGVKTDQLNDATTFESLGADSLSAMNFRNELNKHLNVNIDVVKLLTGSTTLGDVVQYCYENSEWFVDRNEQEFDERAQPMPAPPPSPVKPSAPEHDPDTIRSPTFMQLAVLKDYLQPNGDPILVYMVDIEIQNINLTYAEWHEIINRVVERHSHLRTRFRVNSHDDIEMLMDNPGHGMAFLQQVPFQEMKQTVSYNEDQRRGIKFDLTTEYPAKYQIGIGNNDVLLRLVVHKVVGDLRSVYLMCLEIKTIAESLYMNTLVPEIPQIHDREVIVENALREGKEERCQFWRKKVSCFSEPMTIGNISIPIESKDHHVESRTFSPEQMRDMTEYINRTGMTLFHLIASAYQLLLHLLTGTPCVAVTTDVDMRVHIPELAHQIMRCTNIIPLIATIDNAMSIGSFMNINKVDMLEAMCHSLYPMDEITQHVVPHLRQQLSRHYLIMNDRTEINRLQNGNEQSSAIIRNIWYSPKNRETIVLVRYDLDERSATLEFGYNTKVIDALVGYRLVDKLFAVLDRIIRSNPGDTVGSLGYLAQ